MLATFTLPYGQDLPSKPPQRRGIPYVTPDVSFKLFEPELEASLRHGRFFAGSMAVPKTSVDKNNTTPTGYADVRTTWQRLSMKAVPNAERAKRFPDRQFGS
jgi:hypothetical protein